MINRAVARRYAQALFSLAEEHEQLDRLESDLGLVNDALHADTGLKVVLENQRIPQAQKWEILDKAFGDRCLEITINFLRLLISKRREEYFDEIYEEFRHYADAARGIKEARVTLAEELDEATKDMIRQGLENMTGSKIRMITTIDPDIIGGLVVRIGDERYDGSVRRQLNRIKSTMKGQGQKQKGVTTR